MLTTVCDRQSAMGETDIGTLKGCLAEQLQNNRAQTREFCCNWGISNANKTNGNRSVRTGQVELANRRLEWFSRLNLDRLAWCCHDNVTQMKANLIEKLGLLFESFLQPSRKPLRLCRKPYGPAAGF